MSDRSDRAIARIRARGHGPRRSLSDCGFRLASCRVCATPFAPKKEIDYVIALLMHAGLSEAEAEQRRAVVETCPACKRRSDVPRVDASARCTRWGGYHEHAGSGRYDHRDGAGTERTRTDGAAEADASSRHTSLGLCVRVDAGGCNACDIEIFAALTPVFDVERFGIKVVPSPRHADVILCTGAMTRAMRMPTLRAYDAAPNPKIVIAFGACGCTGGIFHDLYCVWGGIDKILPSTSIYPAARRRRLVRSTASRSRSACRPKTAGETTSKRRTSRPQWHIRMFPTHCGLRWTRGAPHGGVPPGTRDCENFLTWIEQDKAKPIGSVSRNTWRVRTIPD